MLRQTRYTQQLAPNYTPNQEYERLAAWWTSLFPGLVIAMVVMSGNFLGDWFRDRVDPTLRQL